MQNYVTLEEARMMLPGPPSYATVWRWCRRGISARSNGRRIRLKHLYVGRRLFTATEWLDEFLEQLTASAEEEVHDETSRRRPVTPSSRRRQLEAADAILAEAGV